MAGKVNQWQTKETKENHRIGRGGQVNFSNTNKRNKVIFSNFFEAERRGNTEKTIKNYIERIKQEE